MKIDRDFALNCPNLENLILTNNRVSNQFNFIEFIRSPILVKLIVLPPAGP